MALAESFPQVAVAAAVTLAAATAIVFLWLRLRRVHAGRAELEKRHEALREREQQLRHVADVMPALISYVGTDRRYRFVNRLYEAWFRCSTDEVVGKKIDDVLGPETMKFAGEYIDRALRGEEVHFEPEVRYPAGPRWVDAHYVPDLDASGQVAGFCVLVLDVTQRKLAEDAVRQSEGRLWAILDHLSVGVGLIDGEGRLILGNSTMRGYIPERIPSRDPARIHRWRVDGDAVPPERWAAERALRGETIRPGLEFSYRGDDGREVSLLISAVPFRGADGKVTGAIVVLQDITAHKEANRALQAADRRKDEFLATLAHELRNPLAAIRNAAAILTAMGSSNPEARWVPEVIDRQLAQMSRLLEDLLDVSRIAHDKLALRRQRVELSAVVHNAIETCGPQLDAGKHALAVGLPAGPIFLHADPVRLEQVFSNLISNAAKYTPSGGHIRVTGERQGDEVTVSVKDDGVGISPEMLPRLFEIFSQDERALERSQGGLGVGLSLVRGLLGLHGGRVEAKSDGVGKGSEFTVHLPLMAQSPSESLAPRAGEGGTTDAVKRRVLIADDARDSADSLAVILAIKGHEAHTAYDGEEAMAAAARLRPEVIILDIRMPKRNGFEACRWIRAQPWGRGITLIALSGWGTEEDRRRTEEAGFDHHLVKPVAPEVLFALVASGPPQASEPSPGLSLG
ncbi:MAG TPA: PAS domain-containing protein [Polyangia bacterium]|nr:PAS domain-containing protein [Polyangia bacterium]